MPEIIKNDCIVDDNWSTLRLADGESPQDITLPDSPTLFPLAVWQIRKNEILARKTPIGIWLESNESPEAIAADLERFAVIGVNFPRFTDGRGYSTARLLRERHGYRGEIRAIGDVLQDQLFLMKRCGFDAFTLRADKDIRAALSGMHGFGENYQAAVDQPVPLFRRRNA